MAKPHAFWYAGRPLPPRAVVHDGSLWVVVPDGWIGEPGEMVLREIPLSSVIDLDAILGTAASRN